VTNRTPHDRRLSPVVCLHDQRLADLLGHACAHSPATPDRPRIVAEPRYRPEARHHSLTPAARCILAALFSRRCLISSDVLCCRCRASMGLAARLPRSNSAASLAARPPFFPLRILRAGAAVVAGGSSRRIFRPSSRASDRRRRLPARSGARSCLGAWASA
jgi:hypothetical protein